MWKSIPNFPGYEVSDLGEVRSWHSANGRTPHTETTKPRKLNPATYVDSDYLRVSLKCPNSGKFIVRRVHQLVLEAFVGPRPNNSIVMHLNDNPKDNKLSNLKYATNQENSDDMVNKGRSCKGENHPRSLCSDSERDSIISMALLKDYRGSRLEIANILGMDINIIRRVIESYNLKAKKEGKQIAKIRPKDSRI